MIEEARAAAARVQEAETQKAIAAAEQIMVKGRRSGGTGTRPHADRTEPRSRPLVVQTTTKVTGKVLTPDDQKRLAEETAKQVAA